MHETKRILGLTFLALRAGIDRELLRARNVLRTRTLPERHPTRTPPLRPERGEPEARTSERTMADLPRVDVHYSQSRIALARRPGDPEDE
ncbi:MAG: hypothetical protein WBQ44_06420 [Rhodococcus sp. (in: high G+C Gram-positive bacteria)]